MKNIIVVSGYFDPIHVGHIRYLQEARLLGDYVIVILSSDADCMGKKGYVFMPYWERKSILLECRSVDAVVPRLGMPGWGSESSSVAITLEQIYKVNGKFTFCKGGDRTKSNMPKDELDICKKFGIPIKYGVGGGKIQSSSKLVKEGWEKEKANAPTH